VVGISNLVRDRAGLQRAAIEGGKIVVGEKGRVGIEEWAPHNCSSVQEKRFRYTTRARKRENSGRN
jgi:hypothetical protein